METKYQEQVPREILLHRYERADGPQMVQTLNDRDRTKSPERRVSYQQLFRPLTSDNYRRSGYNEIVDHQNGGGKIREQSAGFYPQEPTKPPSENKEKSAERQTRDIIEPIMVKNVMGKKCLYYFEQGSHHLLEVVEGETDAIMPSMIQHVEGELKRMWREIFSLLRVITSFIVICIVELIFHLIHYVFQPLVLNSLTALGNHMLKPLLITLFNNFVQPIFAFAWNTLNAIVMAVNPIIELVSGLINQVAVLLKSIRLFQIDYYSPLPRPQRGVEAV